MSLTEVAERVASEASALVRTARSEMSAGRAVAVDTKSSDTDVVTAVDTEAERLIRDRLTALRPGDAVLGEEGGGPDAADPDGVTWVVDPIDGTVNFLYGHPFFAVSIGAQIGGVSVAGAVVEPVSGRTWTATRGSGAWLNGDRLRVAKPQRLDLTLLATGFSYRAARRERQAQMVHSLLGKVRDIRRAGAASLDLCALAAGWVDGYFEHGLARWDWAAGALIAEEAGAVVVLPGADPALGDDATFAAPPSIAAELRAALIDSGAATV
ncbi:MAG: inositol monophosphatase family protein [Haloechinothrix sp.]